MRIRLQPANRDMLQQMLVEGHFDLRISAYPITDTRLRTELLRHKPVVAVAAKPRSFMSASFCWPAHWQSRLNPRSTVASGLREPNV